MGSKAGLTCGFKIWSKVWELLLIAGLTYGCSKAGLTRGFKIWSKSSSLGNELNLKLNKRLLTETTCEMTNAVGCCRSIPKLEAIGILYCILQRWSYCANVRVLNLVKIQVLIIRVDGGGDGFAASHFCCSHKNHPWLWQPKVFSVIASRFHPIATRVVCYEQMLQ